MKSNTSLAMKASRGYFAYHLIGTMSACHELGMVCPDPEKEALQYLQTFHPEALAKALAKAEADENNALLATYDN